MTYRITGRVCARPCEGSEEPISNGIIRFYGGTKQETTSQKLLAEQQLGENGEFTEVELTEKIRPGTPIDVVVQMKSPLAEDGDKAKTVEATLTTIEFTRESEEQEYKWCLTPDQYCRVMEELGVWYVCGQITNCHTSEPISGLEVQVFDADIIQDDFLGSATTNSNGRYIVYYDRGIFEQTPAPFPPIELIGGPDLYFKVLYGANVILDETPSNWSQSKRKDADRCEHIDLCVEPSGSGPIAAAWTDVGDYAIPGSNDLEDFDEEGYTASEKYAFYGMLTLKGSVPLRNVPILGAGEYPIRYRFKVGDSDLQNGSQEDPEEPDKVVDGDLFDTVKVGTLVYLALNPSGGIDFDQIEVNVESTDLDDGWVRLDEAITEAYNSASNPLANLKDYKWTPAENLARLNTTNLTTESMPDGSNTDTGDPVQGNPPVEDEQFAIRFEVQEKVNNTWENLPGHGWTLNRIVINNNSEFRKFGVVQLENNKCDPITLDNVDLKYTLYHPHMRGARLEIRRSDQSSWTQLDDSDTELSFTNVTTTDSKYDHNYNDQFDIASNVTKECAYMVRLRSRRRLTNGTTKDRWSSEIQAFYAEEP